MKTAIELFEESKRIRTKGMGIHIKTGLPIRLFTTLLRGGFGFPEETGWKFKDRDLNWPKVLAAVETGEIWDVDQIGEKYVMEICRVLAERGVSE